MKRFDTFALSGILGSSMILASLLVFATAYHNPGSADQNAVAAPAKPAHMSVAIMTPDMLKSDVGPAFVPAIPTLPANTDVTITVTNFDDATALPEGSEQYAKASGIVGPLTIEAMDPSNPNAAATKTTTLSLDPATGVSHTFTIQKLGINVPIAPKSRTTFTIHTISGGSYEWQCYDPCGSDPNGWGGAMATAGYMKGTVMLCGGCGAGASGCC